MTSNKREGPARMTATLVLVGVLGIIALSFAAGTADAGVVVAGHECVRGSANGSAGGGGFGGGFSASAVVCAAIDVASNSPSPAFPNPCSGPQCA